MTNNINNTPKVVLVAITKHGTNQVIKLAQLAPDAIICIADKFLPIVEENSVSNPVRAYSGAFRDEILGLFSDFDQIVFFVSLGAVVRLIAPYLKNKDEDPGVLVVDDAGQFVIPVLSGHVGGANAMAERIAALIGATPVLTTASDVGKTIPVDILGRELGWKVEAPKINITRVSAAVVNEEPVAVVQETGSRRWWTRPTPLPRSIHLFERLDDVDLSHFKAVLWITHAEVTPAHWEQLHERLVVYRPPASITVGLGCDRGTPLATVQQALAEALTLANARITDVVAAASITLKADEPSLQALAQQHGWSLIFYTPEQLADVPVPNPSETVRKFTGTPSVSEAAALLATGSVGSAPALIVEKHKLRGVDGKNATISIASSFFNHP